MRHVVIGTFLLLALCTAACEQPPLTTTASTTASGGHETEAPSGIEAAQQGSALVRLVNADPGGTGVDIVWGGDTFFIRVPYKGVTPYLEAPRGPAHIRLRAGGSTEDLSAVNRELLIGRHYTLLALPKDTGGTRLAIVGDSLGLLEPGEARVRLINAATGVDDIDLFIAGTPNRILHGINARTVTATSFVDMEGGTVEIRSPNRPAPTLVDELTVEEDRLSTFIVVGSAGALDVVQIVDRTEGRDRE
jgi:hypothetical protein